MQVKSVYIVDVIAIYYKGGCVYIVQVNWYL